jgi:excisionase family DNA binding protein
MNPSKYPTPSRILANEVALKTNAIEARYLNVRELACYLRKSPAAIHNMVYRRQLTAYKPGGRLLFRKEEIDQWVHKNRLLVGYGN